MLVQTLIELGINKDKFFIDDKTPNYYHPGRSGLLYLKKNENKPLAYFGEIHPNIIKKLRYGTEMF